MKTQVRGQASCQREDSTFDLPPPIVNHSAFYTETKLWTQYVTEFHNGRDNKNNPPPQ